MYHISISQHPKGNEWIDQTLKTHLTCANVIIKRKTWRKVRIVSMLSICKLPKKVFFAHFERIIESVLYIFDSKLRLRNT